MTDRSIAKLRHEGLQWVGSGRPAKGGLRTRVGYKSEAGRDGCSGKPMKPTMTVLDVAGGLASGAATLIDLQYGSSEDWWLRAHFAHGDEKVLVAFDRPTAFRVTDEGNLLEYWSARDGESGFVYQLEGSSWLAEYEASAAHPDPGLKHYLFAGSDECLEVLASSEPVVRRRS